MKMNKFLCFIGWHKWKFTLTLEHSNIPRNKSINFIFKNSCERGLHCRKIKSQYMVAWDGKDQAKLIFMMNNLVKTLTDFELAGYIREMGKLD